MPMLQAGVLAALFLLFLFSRRYRLPPGPPGNVAGEFINVTMPEVFEKWRRKYGVQHDAQYCPTIDLINCV